MKEQDIIKLLLQKNEQGISELLIHYGPLIRYIIAPILTNEQDREDCLSEVVMRVWEKVDTYDTARGSLNAWLTAIARNCALNHKRGAGKHNISKELSEDIPARAPTPEAELLLAEHKAALKHALSQLASKDRTLFYRKYYYLQSTAQIAAETGMTERAVEGKLYRIKKQLRNLLGGEGYGRP